MLGEVGGYSTAFSAGTGHPNQKQFSDCIHRRWATDHSRVDGARDGGQWVALLDAFIRSPDFLHEVDAGHDADGRALPYFIWASFGPVWGTWFHSRRPSLAVTVTGVEISGLVKLRSREG